MVKVWNKFKKMKEAMKLLNKKEYSKVDQRIKDTRGQLQQIQTKLRDCFHDQSLFDQERNLKLDLEKWVLVEESILRQKSRM